MIRYIFEDNEEYILSKFIKHAYTSEEREMLVFLGGNRKVLTKLEEIWKEDEEYVVYLDVIPDNVSTLTEYNKIHKWLLQNNISNVTVLPVPSIEYYFIKALGDLNIPEVDVVFSTADYRNTELVRDKLRGVCDSYEIYCKAVMNHKMDLCKRPMSKSKNLTAKQYYLVDCLCLGPYEKCNEDITLAEKAWSVIRQLPVFYNGQLNKYFKTRHVELKDVESRCIKEYNVLVDKLYLAGIINDKPYL